MATKNKLHILWTNDNLITAEKMVFMYAIYAKKAALFEEVEIIVWGAPTKLTAENKLIQELIEEAKLEGVHISGCKACADQLGVAEILEGLNIELIYQAGPLTTILKDDETLLTI